MPSDLIQKILAGVIRAGLALLGGFLVTHGTLSADDVAALSPEVQQWLGAALPIAVAAWSAYQKHHAATASAVKEQAAAALGSTAAQRAGDPTPVAVQAAANAIVQAAVVSKAKGA